MKPFMDLLMKEKIGESAELLRRGIYTRVGSLNAEYAVTAEPVPFADRLKLKYRPIREGEQWSSRLWDCAWFHITGGVPDAPQDTALCLVFDFEGEGCVFSSDGTPVRGLTNVSSDFDRSLGMPGKRIVPFSDGTFATDAIDLWIETGNNDLFGVARGGRLLECYVAACNTALRNLYYDYRFLSELMQSLPDGDPQHYAIAYALEKVALMAKADLSQQEIAGARSILRTELTRKNVPDPLLKFWSVGHSHLDLAWLWPVRESRRKAGRTFSNALANLKDYPDYIYGASQPQQYAWIKEDYPQLFEKVKQAVRDGRIEIQGGMWVEADTNVTGGESLVRQFLYGQKFWREEFGKEVNVLWLPDVFGFSGAMPQIMRGCGCEYFLTIKLSWNMVNKFPYHSFRWRGIDGSEVLVHMPPEGTYNSSASPKALRKAQENYAERGLSKNAMMLYGIGDGGGGPGREHLEFVKREKNLCGVPPVIDAAGAKFFAALKKEAGAFPVYSGELYLERHQGTYTSQAKNKAYNRRMETLLAQYEFAQVLTGCEEREATEKIWKEVLLYQFHDILPGSSIRRVYDETEERYRALLSETQRATQRLLSEEGGEPCALNATSYYTHTYVKEEGKWYELEAEPWSVGRLQKPAGKFAVYARGNVIGNALVEAELGEDGAIVRLTDKRSGRQILGAPSGRFSLYNDTGNAWDFHPGYVNTTPEIFRLTKSRPFVDGAKAGVVQTYEGGKSKITQTVSVMHGSALVRCDVEAEWAETQKMLRADFYPAVHADEVTCDIQWGNIKRTTRENGSIDRAQFEICAQKWVDVSEQDFGFALINNGKYGYRCKSGCISIDLLRSETYPCADQDKGTQTFSYALYAHEGNLLQSDVAAQAYCFNRPPEPVTALPCGSLVSSSNVHAVIETVKPAEDGKGFIVRLYNDTQYEIRTQISVKGKIVAETNMLERQIKKSHGDLVLHPFEIKTLYCKA